MANKFIKPKKMAWQLISEMKNRGITFNYMNESEAVGYLSNINNYLRTASYRKNYQKYQKGYKQGKYLNLDFAYLVEMSILDMHYRFLIQKMCSDIEHRICVKLIYDVENDPLSNGYDIVHRFLTKRSYELRKIEGTIISPYTSDLLKKYFTIQPTENQKKINHTIIKYDDCPVWVLMELLSFGSIIDFYLEYYSSKGLPHFSRYILNLVRSLRNAAAHNNCILFNLNTGTTVPPQEITNFVKKLGNFSTSQRQARLSSRVVLEFVTLIYVYDKIVTEKVKKHRYTELNLLINKRMQEKAGFFKENSLIKNTYQFIQQIVNFVIEKSNG